MTSPGVGSTEQRLGRYHLAEPLGGGPTGEVFRAKVYGVAGFDRQFAVKRFHAEFVKDPDTAAEISAAARTYGSLEHPRIARLNEHGVTGGYTFTATELIHGLDLARLNNTCATMERPLPAGAAMALISQVSRTIGYAHGRGICHLGLCPTNLIVTPEGEVNVTDFGFLPARLGNRPGNDSSLRARLPYLAPEQVSGEPTSAATDVYQLGVIACELLGGKPAFTGATSQEIAQRILTAQPALPALPRPLHKALQRCLARSPFERYPDARALADAIDAATRSTPLPGGAHDVSAAVRAAMEHLETMSEEQVSGAVSFPLPAPPRGHVQRPARSHDHADSPRTTMRMPHLGPAHRARLDTGEALGTGALDDAEALIDAVSQIDAGTPASAVPVSTDSELEATTTPVRAPSSPLPPFRPLRGPGQDLRPIKMPPLVGPAEDMEEDVPTKIRERDKGFVSVPTGPRHGTATPVALSALGKRDGDGTGRPSGRAASAPLARAGSAPAAAQDSAAPAQRSAAPAARPGPEEGDDVESLRLDTIPPEDLPHLSGAAPTSTAPAAAPPAPASAADAVVQQRLQTRRSAPVPVADGVSPKVKEASSWEPLTPVPRDGMGPPGARKASKKARPATADTTRPPPAKPARSRRSWLIAPLVIAAGLAGGYTLYDRVIAERVAAALERSDPADAGAALATTNAGRADEDASSAGAPHDAGVSDADTAELPGDGKLAIRSSPGEASVYLDGSLMGTTPITLDATSDRHRLALILPGHKLHTADINGSGEVSVSLEEVSPPEGPAGVKIRCSRKNRYYVLINGADTGQLCPSERIGVSTGSHTVEIYDPVTDSRREFPVVVKNTRRSVRVRVD